MSVSADTSNASLDEDLNYFVQVSASTSAGGGIVSNQHVTTFSSGVVGGVVGGVVAVVLIIEVTVVILAVLATRSKLSIVKPTARVDVSTVICYHNNT